MYCRLLLFCALWICVVNCVPTRYKYNEHRVLEPDLIPVSSTVIPLPVYKVSAGFNVAPTLKDEKIKRPEGPISLVTVHSKKKATEIIKPKTKPNNDISSIKQISQQQFGQ